MNIENQNIVSVKESFLRLSKLNLFAKKIYESNELNSTINVMDISNNEVQEFLISLHKHEVKYMLVGGVALVFHGHIRTTQDLNLWVQDIPENRKKLVKALEEVNVVGASHYEKVQLVPGWSTITIGDHGFEADIMGHLKAFSKEDFEVCFSRAKKGEYDDIPITVIHINDLIKEKKATGRAKDIDDVLNLERIKSEQKNK